MACAGDVPTLETLAAVSHLRADYPDIRIRVVNVVDLMVLETSPNIPMEWNTRISMSCSRLTSR